MNDQNKSVFTLTMALLGAINLIIGSLGFHVLANNTMNGIAMLVSVLFVIGGIIYNHFKHTTVTTVETPTPQIHIVQLPTASTPAPLSETPVAPNAPPTAADIQKKYDEIASGNVTVKDISTI